MKPSLCPLQGPIMPNEDAHSRQAAHNRRFIDFLKIGETDYVDWVVTAIFYTAVHLVEGFLAPHGSHPTSHSVRCNAMSRFESLKPVYKDYMELHHQSERSRYHCVEFDRTHVKTRLLAKLAPIESRLQSP